VAHGDEAAYAELFHIHRAKLYSFALRISGSRQIAEDIVQDVFIKIWQVRKELPEIRNFNAYLFRMAHNHLLNSIKRMARETLLKAQMSGKYKEAEEGIYGQMDSKELERLVYFAVDGLPPRQKMIYRLSKERNMKQEEISERLNISVVTVKSHMTQAFRSIRRKITNAYPVIFIYLLLVLPGCCLV
jgi:RNA polymerase sigma-70 factor (ECF subfamily)